MEILDQRQFAALLENNVNVRQGGRGVTVQGGSADALEESVVRAYNHTLLSGRIIQAVRRSTIWEGGGVLGLGDSCTKIGIQIREVL